MQDLKSTYDIKDDIKRLERLQKNWKNLISYKRGEPNDFLGKLGYNLVIKGTYELSKLEKFNGIVYTDFHGFTTSITPVLLGNVYRAHGKEEKLYCVYELEWNVLTKNPNGFNTYTLNQKIVSEEYLTKSIREFQKLNRKYMEELEEKKAYLKDRIQEAISEGQLDVNLKVAFSGVQQFNQVYVKKNQYCVDRSFFNCPQFRPGKETKQELWTRIFNYLKK